MIQDLGKIFYTARVSISDYLVYRFNFACEFIGPVLIFFAIKYHLWKSVFLSNPEASEINGYTLGEMLSYQGWTLVVGLIAGSFHSANLHQDIRLGKISSFLIYPFSFLKYQFSKYLGFIFIQSLIAILSCFVLLYAGVLTLPPLLTIIKASILILSASLLWYFALFIIASFAFWLEATVAFRVAFMMAARLLGGSFVPLEFFPTYFQKILHYTPFPYLMFYPVKLLGGNGAQFLSPFISMMVWTVILVYLSIFVWKKGLKNYTAAGM